MAPPKAKNPKKTARFYNANPDAKAKKDSYNTEFNKKPSQRAKRAQLAKVRRDRGVMGKGGNDMSHTKDGRIVPESPSVNRGRNRGKK
jgi:hypothetical protein